MQHDSDRSNIIHHPCNAPAAWWSLRILVDLEGWKQLRGYPNMLTSDGRLLRTIGLGHLEDRDMPPRIFLKTLKERQKALGPEMPPPRGAMTRNLALLSHRLGLNDTEQAVLHFAITVHSHAGLEEILCDLGEVTTGRLFELLSVILGRPITEIAQALRADGMLSSSGLLRLERSLAVPVRHKLEPAYGLVDLMFEPHRDVLEMLRYYFRPASEARLSSNDFSHFRQDYRLLLRYLRIVQKQGMPGVNLLFYGPPGTGKSELARTLARELGVALFEVNASDPQGDPIPGYGRFSAYRLSQHVLSRSQEAMILFDEIEDVFEEHFHPRRGWEHSGRAHKAWINQLLEGNPRPAIWISNRIDDIDPAFLRRFDYILEMKNPPRSVRQRILSRYLAETSVSPQWIQRAAENPHISPALVARAAKVAAVLEDGEKGKVESELERILGNTLKAMGHGNRVLAPAGGNLPYRLEALNPDHDLERLLRGLQHTPRGRICLYGPPGTGKTAFGHHTATVLERPLLIKRASDLLDPYVGMTEKHLAGMFEQAMDEDAVLMLDEADSLLRERTTARNSWEVTQVNELLTRMEAFEGLFICSTNLIEDLDEASIRRFDFKIRFDYLTAEQAWILFRELLQTEEHSLAPYRPALSRLTNLTPGDFATATRRSRLLGEPLTAEGLLADLERESRFKSNRHSRGIGFNADI